MQTTDERMRIEVIGQRLLTGRMCIAEVGRRARSRFTINDAARESVV